MSSSVMREGRGVGRCGIIGDEAWLGEGWGREKRRGGKKGIILKSSISSNFMQLKKGFEYVILC